MRVKTLVATRDTDYTGRIAECICERHADMVEISVCNSGEHLQRMLGSRRYDVALVEPALLAAVDIDAVRLPMLLWSEADDCGTVFPDSMPRIKKHSRVSRIVSAILEEYASVSGDFPVTSGDAHCGITAVWSPCGGIGKSTVALAFATSEALKGREVFYLSLESFSASSVCFNEQARSISSVFEMLEGGEGNVRMLISGISTCEGGIRHLGAPDNFDDISILTPENVSRLIASCAGISDELVIDLSSVCNACVRQVFELAGRVLLVTSYLDTARVKLEQFLTQSNVFEGIRDKTTFVVNRLASEGAEADVEAGLPMLPKSVVHLPYIPAIDTQFVYKALAKCDFGA